MVDRDSQWPQSALRMAGFDPCQAVALRPGHCACFRMERERLFVRVGRPGTESQAANAVRFAAACAPGLDVLPPLAPPMLTTAGPVTLWPLLDPVPGEVDHRWFGRTLRGVHDLTDPPAIRHEGTGPAVAWARWERYSRSLFAEQGVVEHVREVLREIEDLKRQVLPRLAQCLIHGDAYSANVVTTRERSFLIDYDSAGVGARYWDLAPIVVGMRRFGLAAHVGEGLFAGYGIDPRDDPLFRRVVRIRELGAITYLLDLAGTSPAYQRELDHRLSSYESEMPWTGLEDLSVMATKE